MCPHAELARSVGTICEAKMVLLFAGVNGFLDWGFVPIIWSAICPCNGLLVLGRSDDGVWEGFVCYEEEKRFCMCLGVQWDCDV